MGNMDYMERKRRAGGILLDGMIALFLVFILGFAFYDSLLRAGLFLNYDQAETQAVEILEAALLQVHADPTQREGQTQVGQQRFDWKAQIRNPVGYQEVEVSVFWKTPQGRIRQVTQQRDFREGT